MTRTTTNTKTGLAVHEAAARLAAWIINGYGAQDWLDKIDEHAEPVAFEKVIPYVWLNQDKIIW